MAKNLSQKQVLLIRLAKKEAQILARKHPEIANQWRKGKTYEQIASLYLGHLLGAAGRLTIYYALKKLLSKKDREKISHRHFQNSGRMVKEKKLGIFGLTEEQRSKRSKNGVLARVRNMGLAPYEEVKRRTEFGVMTEIEYAQRLASLRRKNPEYTWRLVALHVNAIFGNNRDRNTIHRAVSHRENK